MKIPSSPRSRVPAWRCRKLHASSRGQHAGFKVRGKTFAWFLNDHHGDGIVSIACKATLGDNEEMVKRDPERFYLPAYLWPKGWVALRLDRGEVDWDEVAELAATSYCLVAPRSRSGG